MVEKVLLVLFVVNVVLSAASGALHALKAKFPALESADTLLGKIVAVSQKIVDFLSANVAHPVATPAPAPQEAPKA
jgi:hypothetical protein